MIHVQIRIYVVPVDLGAIAVVVVVEFSITIDVIITDIAQEVTIDVGLIRVRCTWAIVIYIANTITIAIGLDCPQVDAGVECVTILIGVRKHVAHGTLRTCAECN